VPERLQVGGEYREDTALRRLDRAEVPVIELRDLVDAISRSFSRTSSARASDLVKIL
jgi:hypothetical protein